MKIYCITRYGTLKSNPDIPHGYYDEYKIDNERKNFYLTKEKAQKNLLKEFLEFSFMKDDDDESIKYFLDNHAIIEEDRIRSKDITWTDVYWYGDIVDGGVRIDEIEVI